MSTSYTIIGTPFSTFTRTITMGMQHKGLGFNQVSTPPQTEIALNGHPFGYLPTLIIHNGEGKQIDVKLRESQAIVRYIDRIAPEPSLHLTRGGDGALRVLEEKMWEFVSFTACFGFPIIEGGVIKPRLKAMDERKLNDAEVREQIQDGVEKMCNYLTLMESLMAPEGYIFGETPTWADFFLFPIMADLRMIPEWKNVNPRLTSWIEKMDELPAAKATAAGTLSAGGRPW